MPKRQQITLGIRLKTDRFSGVDSLEGPVVIITCNAIKIRIAKAGAVEDQAQIVAISHCKVPPERFGGRLFDHRERGCFG